MKRLRTAFPKVTRVRIAIVCVAILGLSVLHMVLIGLLPYYSRFTLGLVSSFLLLAVHVWLLKVLFRILATRRLDLVLGLAHFLFICGFTVTMHHARAVDPGFVMMWGIPALIDMPSSLIALLIVPFLAGTDIGPSSFSEAWIPGAFFAVVGSFQYYVVGRLIQAGSDARANPGRSGPSISSAPGNNSESS